MVLRLGSQNNASPTGALIDRLVQDTSLSWAQKIDGLKVASVVMKNLNDPVKSQDAKYRTLKLDNAKLQKTLFSVSYLRDMLSAVGFVETTNDEGVACLVVGSTTADCDRMLLQTCATELAVAQSKLTVQPTNKRPSASQEDFSKLSEKQKARRMMQDKEQVEKQRAKEERKRNLALLKQDKITRETDPNWKPGVSAACAKSGTGISTFRDKYGEN